MKKRTIITGPPGSGKSTLISALEKKTFPCMQEVARAVIISEQNTGKDGMPWKNMTRFAQLVYDKTLDQLQTDESLFCDRSLLDTIAYLEHAEIAPFEELLQFNFHKYYDSTVFFAPPWAAIYEKDRQRPQRFEEQLLLSKKLIAVYKKYGFNLILMPLTDTASRVRFILENQSSRTFRPK